MYILSALAAVVPEPAHCLGEWLATRRGPHFAAAAVPVAEGAVVVVAAVAVAVGPAV